MPYVIMYKGCEAAAVTARVASDALVMAEDLEAHGWEDVRVTTPDGDTYPVRQFAQLVRKPGR